MAATAADAITLLRVLLTPAFIAGVVQAQATPAAGWVAAAVFAIAAWSDVADGRIARRCGTASDRGRALDHFADIVFVLGALGAYVYLGVVPWWVPASIAGAFSVYVIDSWARTVVEPALVGSRLGHAGGVANYVLIGVLVFDQSAGLRWLPAPLFSMLFVLVPLYSGAGAALRLVARRESET